MESIVLNKQNVEAAYKVADENIKVVLTALFGESAVKPVRPEDVRERVKSYEDACKELGLPVVTDWENMTPDEVAYIKLKTIVRALNEGWVPDWEDSDQYKYWVWFNMSDLKEWYSRVVARSYYSSGAGGGVSCANASSDSTNTNSYFGSRLAFRGVIREAESVSAFKLITISN